MNATCRQVEAPSPTELSYDIPVSSSPSSGTAFHSLQATSQALQPMQTDVSVKKPIRGGWSWCPATAAGSSPLVWSSGYRLTSHLGTCLAGDPGPVLVLPDQFSQRGPARPPSRADVTGQRLHLLDVHVRVQGQVSELVGRVAGGVTVRAPVVGEPDLVQLAAL